MNEIQPVSISSATDTPNISLLIYTIRNQQVMLASDLAMLYQVETRVLNQAVKRNQKRFPERYCFQLTKEEAENLTSQIVMSSFPLLPWLTGNSIFREIFSDSASQPDSGLVSPLGRA